MWDRKILALGGVILSVHKRKCFQSPRTWEFSIGLSSSSRGTEFVS